MHPGKLKDYQLETDAVVMNCDVLTAMKRLEGKDYQFDVVFMDPPYRMEWEKKVLEYFTESSLIGEETTIIIEASLDTDFDYLDSMGYEIMKEKNYKTNKHVFVKRTEKE